MERQYYKSHGVEPESILANVREKKRIEEWDVYRDSDNASTFLSQFEIETAEEFSKEDAVFMPSGVMAQSIAFLINQKPDQNTSPIL